MKISVGILLLFCSIMDFMIAVDSSQEKRLASFAKLVKAGEFPYLVSIQVNGRHFCGGSLIGPRHVLTAAHCISSFIRHPDILKNLKLTVEVGSVHLGEGKTHEISRLSRKDDFDIAGENPFVLPNDVAVITLKTAVKESASVKCIALPEQSLVIPPNSSVIIVGFGSSQSLGPMSSSLKKAEVFVLSQSECNEFYGRTANKAVLSSHICTKRGPGYGTCQGDSGGPLVYNKKIVGVISAGDTECDQGYPDVSTRVSSHLQYIGYELSYKFTGKKLDYSPAKAIDIDAHEQISPKTTSKARAKKPVITNSTSTPQKNIHPTTAGRKPHP